jgi:hypothetical protein
MKKKQFGLEAGLCLAAESNPNYSAGGFCKPANRRHHHFQLADNHLRLLTPLKRIALRRSYNDN